MPDIIPDTLDYARIGQELKRTREQRNLTQQYVADNLKIARTTLIAIEKGDRRIRAEELIALVRERKGAVQAPKSVEFLDAIPLSPLGKPDKKALRAMYAA